MYYKMSKEQLDEILHYLIQHPYKDVFKMCGNLMHAEPIEENE